VGRGSGNAASRKRLRPTPPSSLAPCPSFLIVPDMLKNSPMFKRIEPKAKAATEKAAARGRGRGRGRGGGDK